MRRSLLATAVLLLLAGCATAGEGEPDPGGEAVGAAGEEPATRTVEHAAGTTEVPVRPERVATTSEALAGHLASAGVLPVAGPEDVTEWLEPYAEAGLLGDLEPGDVEEIGTSEEPDLERLAALEPDLILIEEFSIEQHPVFDEIAPTVVVSRPTNADWQEAFDQTVAAAGVEDAAGPVRDRYEALLDDVPAAAPDTEVTFLRGSGPGQFRLDALGGFGGSVAEEAGYAVDVGDATPSEAREGQVEYSNERLDVVDGDLLVTTTQEEGGPSSIDELAAGPLWAGIPAVRSGRIVELPQPIYNGGTYVAAELLLQALADAS